jgi:hypothetical protein
MFYPKPEEGRADNKERTGLRATAMLRYFFENRYQGPTVGTSNERLRATYYSFVSPEPHRSVAPRARATLRIQRKLRAKLP